MLSPASPRDSATLDPAQPQLITLSVNGIEHTLGVGPRRTLLDALRHDLHMTGTKKVCDMGDCGACTVLVEGRAMYACLLLAVDCQDRAITTIEGLAGDDDQARRGPYAKRNFSIAEPAPEPAPRQAAATGATTWSSSIPPRWPTTR